MKGVETGSGEGGGGWQEVRAVRLRTADHTAAATSEEKAEWVAAARAFIEGGELAQPTPAKMRRLAAHDWLVALGSGRKAAMDKLL